MLPEPLVATNAPALLQTRGSGARVYTGWTEVGEGFLSRRELNRLASKEKDQLLVFTKVVTQNKHMSWA